MLKYLARRTAGWLLMIAVATNLVYFLAWGFLDPRANYVGRRPPLDEAQIQALLGPRNLSDTTPLIERWWNWLTGIVLRWDWGVSPVGQSVNEQIAYRVWVSAELVLGATIITTLLGIGLGIYTASPCSTSSCPRPRSCSSAMPASTSCSVRSCSTTSTPTTCGWRGPRG